MFNDAFLMISKANSKFIVFQTGQLQCNSILSTSNILCLSCHDKKSLEMAIFNDKWFDEKPGHVYLLSKYLSASYFMLDRISNEKLI